MIHRSASRACKTTDPKSRPDEVRFLRSWLQNPLRTGAVSPSGRALARTMANYVDPARPGPVIELGPGTGPVTNALLRRGVAEDRLVLIEFNPEFCTLLRARFPRATVIQGDAYGMKATLGDSVSAPAAAVVSSLPLFTRPVEERYSLLDQAFEMSCAQAPFIQFTYAVVSPMPLRPERFDAHVSQRVWANLPPARVWVYRAREAGQAAA
ncbi:class I SAM-dependent methyltransferase [Ancylobacter amanitiformis]|uniref:Phosphatidylethanolamine/phosphatidyl-N-methylethanolamine N-methyltransferase n=1 Tax=Ancylobacter amanitiformis TaxID=217069 RepID=A0ABU0LQJ7_9HYPH|nr:rRNA adenine N-6-methyltransferase family protein [Ancylobacter amanitiformis]MDQ0510983.1 phosphatidylethanolamine/phosphatidyl-N-methylethanolamine N-methyltransferase [Ancylobacter amanitiformis]